MNKTIPSSLGLLVFIVLAACTQEQTATEAQVETEPPFRPVATIQEIMQVIVAPAADAIWNTVSEPLDLNGLGETQPGADAEWQMVQNNALLLIAATNLLIMEGRSVKAPDATLEDEGLEGNLTADQIQTAIAENRQAFVTYANSLHDAAMEAIMAIDARNFDALSNSGETINEACEACHRTFWYPDTQ